MGNDPADNFKQKTVSMKRLRTRGWEKSTSQIFLKRGRRNRRLVLSSLQYALCKMRPTNQDQCGQLCELVLVADRPLATPHRAAESGLMRDIRQKFLPHRPTAHATRSGGPYAYGGGCYIERQVVINRFGHRVIRRVRVCD
jgi:hypothetical protein